MLSRTLRLVPSFLLIFAVFGGSLFSAHTGQAAAQAPSPAVAQTFRLPLGYRDGVSYGPRINYRSGQLIEDSEYGVMNPDMQGSTCFNKDWGSIYHSGEDLYRKDGQSTAQAEVTAAADGVVKYIAYNFPGGVMLIEHSLPPDGQQKIYSLYGHLDPNSITVSVNQSVVLGQKLGTVLQQFFDGRYTANHDDSHLHFELRYFYDASSIYPNYPNCNGYLPGRGYTYPDLPSNFPPSQTAHYTDPIAYIVGKEKLYLPLAIKQPTACGTDQPLWTNGGFESGSSGWVELNQPGYPIITNAYLPTPAYQGSWAAWFGGRNNATERIYQSFTVGAGMTSLKLTYQAWVGTDETGAQPFDTLYVRLRDANDNLIQQLDALDNTTPEHIWTLRSVALPDLVERVGQTLRLSFEGTTDDSAITHFLVDNTSLTLNCPGSGAAQPGHILTSPTHPAPESGAGPEPTRRPAPIP